MTNYDYNDSGDDCAIGLGNNFNIILRKGDYTNN